MYKKRIIISSPFSDKKLISYGIALFCLTTNKWLLVKPFATPNYMSLIRGFYRQSELENIISYTDIVEKRILLKLCNNESNFEEEYNRILQHSSEEDKIYSIRRFIKMKHHILSVLLKTNISAHIEWSWPKGRKNNNEFNILDAALREFEEETGLSRKDISILSDEAIISNYKSNNGRTYETQCWIYTCNEEFPVESVSINGEIQERKWFSDEEIRELFKPDKNRVLENPSHSSRLHHFEDCSRHKNIMLERTKLNSFN